MLALPEEWQQWCIEQPESGMGYQIVHIILNDCTILTDVTIVDCEYVYDAEFDVDEISTMFIKGL